jgi:hypothetical protein
MELLFAALGGLIIGLIVRYSLPGRERMGAIIIPGTAMAAAAVIWEILTWLHMPYNGGWIWVITLGLTAVKSVLFDLWLSRRRAAHDAQAFAAALSGAKRA